MHDWLVPSTIASLLGNCIVAAVNFHLWYQKKERALGLWTLAWSIYVVRGGFVLVDVTFAQRVSILPDLLRWLDMAMVLLMLAATCLYFLDRFPRWPWLATGVAVALWSSIGSRLDLGFFTANAPLFFLQCAIFIVAGVMFLRHSSRAIPSRHIVGTAFILWGLHKADFPFLRPIEEFAPWGFMLSSIFPLILAIGIILVFMEESEHRLRRSETDYRRRFQEIGVVQMMIDPFQGTIVDANQAAADFYGYSIERLRRLSIFKVAPDYPAVHLIETVMKPSGDSEPLYSRHRCANGTLRDVEVHSTPIEYNDKSILFCVVHDITERLRAERDRDSLFDVSADLLCIATADGRFERVNPAFTATLGWPTADLVGAPIQEIIHPDDHVASLAVIAELFEKGSIHEFENRMTCKEGGFRWISWSAIAHEGRIYAMGRDNSRRRENERQLKIARAEAESANRAKSEFLTTMSHELRTPLNAVIGFADMMARKTFGPLGDPRYEEYAQAIQRSGQGLLDTINTILDLSKIEAGSVALKDDFIELRPAIEECLRMVQPRAIENGVQLNAPPVNPNFVIKGDARLLRQMFANVLSNAVKFTPTGGSVSVDITSPKSNGGVEIAVIDSGIGIKSADIPKVLEPFTQIDNPMTRKYPGTGLGLPLAKKIAERHGGHLTIESRPGIGTTVRLFIPEQRRYDRMPAPDHP